MYDYMLVWMHTYTPPTAYSNSCYSNLNVCTGGKVCMCCIRKNIVHLKVGKNWFYADGNYVPVKISSGMAMYFITDHGCVCTWVGCPRMKIISYQPGKVSTEVTYY